MSTLRWTIILTGGALVAVLGLWTNGTRFHPLRPIQGKVSLRAPLSRRRLRLLRRLIQTPPSSLVPVTGATGTTANARLQNITETEADSSWW